VFALIAFVIAVVAPAAVVIPVRVDARSSVPIEAPDENTFTEETETVPVTPEI
jgi:hypothetical protein